MAKQYFELVSEPKRLKIYEVPHALNEDATRDGIAFLAEQLPSSRPSAIAVTRSRLSCSHRGRSPANRSYAVQGNGGAQLAPPSLMGKEIRLLVFATAASDALVHQELYFGPAIFAPPRSSLVGGRGVALTHCARRDYAANWNAALLK